jgi:hypothetical protein
MRKGIDCRGVEWEENSKQLSPDKDLVGQVFGRLSVQFRVQNDKQGNSYWMTFCECGNDVVVKGVSLRNKHTTSCGCAQREIASKKLTKPFSIGEQIGYFTVIKQADGYLGKGAYWHVVCRCGTEKIVQAESLRNGSIVSCGCYHKEVMRDKNLIDLTGRRFGCLTVLKLSDNQFHNELYWTTRCDCGTIKDISGHSMKSGNTISCGCKKRSVGEMIIDKLLTTNEIAFKPEYIFTDLISVRDGYLRFDFAVLDVYDRPIRLIEFDGLQHYKSIDYFGGDESFQILKENDELKNQYALSHNIPLVRIPYSKRDTICIADLLGDQFLIKGEIDYGY